MDERKSCSPATSATVTIGCVQTCQPVANTCRDWLNVPLAERVLPTAETCLATEHCRFDETSAFVTQRCLPVVNIWDCRDEKLNLCGRPKSEGSLHGNHCEVRPARDDSCPRTDSCNWKEGCYERAISYTVSPEATIPPGGEAKMKCNLVKANHSGTITLRCSEKGGILTADASDCGKLPYDGDPYGSFSRVGIIVLAWLASVVAVAYLIRKMEKRRKKIVPC
eukprot:g564.t1